MWGKRSVIQIFKSNITSPKVIEAFGHNLAFLIQNLIGSVGGVQHSG
jgi:hypothetical protein